MSLGKLLVYLESSPALRLLRSPNAPFIVDFLDQQFKRPGRITIPMSDLLPALTQYCEDVRQNHLQALRDKPETYLSDWCSRETRWLHRYMEAGREEPVYQLTPHTEEVIFFLDRVLQQDLEFVGTESRLKLVIDTLADLVVGSSDDPRARLESLRRERQRIDREIGRIENDGQVTRYHPAQVRERFSMAVSLLRQLQGDFRAVEEKFKSITQEVRQRQVGMEATRGEILQYVLDAEEVLKREDQGVSFYEFVRFILSPSQQEKLEAIIGQLGHVQEVAEQHDGLETVRKMMPLLIAEAQKVMRTNQRLSATLRRLLDVRAHAERQRVAQLLHAIRSLAASLADSPPVETVGLAVEAKLDMACAFARTFWKEPQRLETVDLAEHESDAALRREAFQTLARLCRLDWRSMRGRVRSAVEQTGSVTMGRLLAEHPPQAGVVEVLGYLQIARDDGHRIDPDAVEEVLLPPQNGESRRLTLTVPLVTFVSS